MDFGEILGKAIGNVRVGKNVYSRISKDFPNDKWTRHCTVEELTYNYGISHKNAEKINAVVLMSSNISDSFNIKNKFDSSDLIYNHFAYLNNLQHEECYALFLDCKLNLIHEALIGVGGRKAALVDPAKILKNAIITQCSHVILVHNHPSGNSEPSKSDRDLTNKVFSLLKLVGIEFCDHIIIGDDYYSFKNEGLI